VAERLLAQRPDFLSFIRARVPSSDLAEDLLQAAYVKLLSHGADLRDPSRAEAWFYRVLRNLIADHYREAAIKRSRDAGTEGLEAIPAPAVEARNLCPCMGRQLDRMSPAYAEALRTVDVEEVPVGEYARLTGISADNASVRLHRARRALRARVEAVCQSCAGAGCLDCTCAPS
jgi:RNA polymerase sigma-70 factor (ECF subfamily)